jgi:hypothetical protein
VASWKLTCLETNADISVGITLDPDDESDRCDTGAKTVPALYGVDVKKLGYA